ncbi:LAMI_0A00672g1_1 [Lachancea mirantina]|uniref:LAMI_0A00672g1_1 n=1 Tax=Lachancea mirantina TaxID=1230905 RepID=A0A1G4ILC0_9SACH|nr:LAMI_0A00672g1_1 [Lachancea mirantina]
MDSIRSWSGTDVHMDLRSENEATSEKEIGKALVRENTRNLDNDGQYAGDDYLDPPPDGGYGWVCCVCVAVMNFATWGPNTCYGIFLSFFLSSNYFPGATPTDYALIGGLVIGLTLILLPLSAFSLSCLGYRATLSIAIVLESVAFIASSFVKTIGGLYVTYGVLLGLSFGLSFGANTIIIPSWFLRRRALANAVSHIGVGSGGCAFSFAVNALIAKTGNHQWAMRMLAIVTFVLNAIAMLFVKERQSEISRLEKPSMKVIAKEIYDPSILKIMPLHFCTLWASFTTMGYVILLFSLSNYAISLGMSPHQATIALAIFNASQTFGRPFMGWISEKIGRSNASIILMLYDLVLLLPFWLNIRHFREIIPFAVLLGFGAGIGAVNSVPLIADVVGIKKFRAGIGYNNFWNGAFSIVAEIIGLRLRQNGSPRPYLHCQIYVVMMYFAGILFLIPYRESKVRRMMKAKLLNKKLDGSQREAFERRLSPTIGGYIKRCLYSIQC